MGVETEGNSSQRAGTQSYCLDPVITRTCPLNLQRRDRILIEENQLNGKVPSLGQVVACDWRTATSKLVFSTDTAA